MSTTVSAPRGQTLTLPTAPLFGTDGIRGRMGRLLTLPLAQQVGFWAGKTWQTHAQTSGGLIILGRDSRCSSPALAAAMSEGLTAAGLEVWDVGLGPTPAIAHLTQATTAIGGVMISASHNPPEDNGIKLFAADGSKVSPALQMEIEMALRLAVDHALPAAQPQRYQQRPELLQDYQQAVLQPLHGGRVKLLKGMKIVLDLAWGAAVFTAPRAFLSLGAEVICLHREPRGDRINVNCGSTHLAPLQKAVLAHQADLGLAFDGDADRMLAVDNQGQTVDGDYILYLWGRYLQQHDQLPNQLIVATVMSNLGFERAWQRQGGKFIRTLVGDQHVHRVMHHSGAMIGGEQSGHILCRHYGVTGDGLSTALHLARLVQESGHSLATLVQQSFRSYPQELRNVAVTDAPKRQHWEECQPLSRACQQAKVALGQQGRLLIRPSGTEPLLRIMVEAAAVSKAHFWANHLAAVAQRHLGD